tara:strand:- start:3304 stop:4389 length:1086 start_codon:yes stop_codon:yes gene_type:complete
MNILGAIINLRRYSLTLFCLSFFALIGTLLFHNILVEFKFKNSTFPLNLEPETIIKCNQHNNFCLNFINQENYVKPLDNCNKHETIYSIIYNNKSYGKDGFLNLEISDTEKLKFSNSNNFYVKVLKSGPDNKVYIDKFCIKNSEIYETYKKFPFLFDAISNIRNNPKYTAGTSSSINPYIYGESSISNIAKRFPQNYIFKSLLYLSTILIFLYWRSNNLILNYLKKEKNKNNLFLIFGYCSGIFLFLHVLMLGNNFEFKILMLFKRLVIVFFILSEILAQFYLIKSIKNNLNIYLEKINKRILTIKIIFIYSIIFVSIFVLGILIFRDLTKEVDYIIEWNYFTILLFFYLLSFFMWKKTSQ